MRKSLLVMGAIAIGSIAFAQKDGRRDHRGHPEEQMERVLSLNPSQADAIRKINQKYGDKAKAVRDNSTLQGEQRMKAHQDIRMQRDAEVAQVLTSEQAAQWKAYKQGREDQRHAQHQRRMQHHDQHMKERLELSDDQVKKIDEARAGMRDKAKALRQANATKEEFKKLEEEHEATMKSILTPDQFAKWKEGQSKRKDRHMGHGRHH